MMRDITIACFLMAALFLGGCASDMKPSAAQTPATTPGAAATPPAAVLVPPGDTSQPEPGTMRIKVYRGSNDAKWLLPEVFQVKKNDHPARTAMELLAALTNFGNPIVKVVDGNHKNRGELYLVHEWVGGDLQLDQAQLTLQGIKGQPELALTPTQAINAGATGGALLYCPLQLVTAQVQ